MNIYQYTTATIITHCKIITTTLAGMCVASSQAPPTPGSEAMLVY